MAVWLVNLVDPGNKKSIGSAKIFARDEEQLAYAVDRLKEAVLTVTVNDPKGDTKKSTTEQPTVTQRFEVVSVTQLPHEHDSGQYDSIGSGSIFGFDLAGSDPSDVDTIPDSNYATVTLNDDVSLIVHQSAQNDAHRVAQKYEKMRFYFSPLFILQSKEAVYYAVGQNHYVRFPMFLYDDSLRRSVVDIVKSRENITIKMDQVSLLPINRIEMVESLGAAANLRYVFPVTSAPGSTRPVLSPRHWVDMVFGSENEARAFLARLVVGQASFIITLPFSGMSTTTDMAIIKFSQNDKTKMRNTLSGSGGDRYVSRGQQMAVTREILSTMEQYNYQESSVRQEINSQTVMRLFQDQTFPKGSQLDLASYNSDVWAKFSDYGFDKRDIAPDKITKIVKDIKDSKTYKTANSKNIGGSAQASFLGFGGSASGNYQTQEEYTSAIESAFHMEQDGEWYVPKAINVTQSLNISVAAETIITSVSSVKRPGEGRLVIQREASSKWTPAPDVPVPQPQPEVELSLGPFGMSNIAGKEYSATTITVSNAKKIRVLFDTFSMEKTWDFVICYGANTNKLNYQAYTGIVPSGSVFWSLQEDTNSMKVITVTDSTGPSAGWRVQKVRAIL